MNRHSQITAINSSTSSSPPRPDFRASEQNARLLERTKDSRHEISAESKGPSLVKALNNNGLGSVEKLWKGLRKKCELPTLELCLSSEVVVRQHLPLKFNCGKPLDEMWKSGHFAV